MNKRRNTLLFAAAVLLLPLLWLAVQRFTHPEGAYAEVQSHGQIIARLSLSEDAGLPVGGAGQGYNRIRVQDGMVFVEEADCPDQICVREGKKCHAGDTIVCLPHELLLVVRADGDDADAYTR